MATVRGRRPPTWPAAGGFAAGLLLAAALLAAAAAAAPGRDTGLALPPGFVADVYVSGRGFDSSGERRVPGIPAMGTLGLDGTGTLYLARTGARFRSGEVEDLWPLYRIPPGGADLTAETESNFLYGPPLPNPQVGTVTRDGTVWITTYDRDRQLGALYRVVNGRPTLFAGGRPDPGAPPVLRHPEGVAVDAAGRVYVTDREQDAVLRFTPTGALLSPPYARMRRVRMLAFDPSGLLWLGGDGTAETPFGPGMGEIWRVGRDGAAHPALTGPLPAGMAVGPGGILFVAQRRTGQLFAVTPEGDRIEFGSARSGSFVRGLAFAPDTPETRRTGVAGDLFVIVAPRTMWLVNDVVRISGPFEAWLRDPAPPAP
jgi:streptogramin lyase